MKTIHKYIFIKDKYEKNKILYKWKKSKFPLKPRPSQHAGGNTVSIQILPSTSTTKMKTEY